MTLAIKNGAGTDTNLRTTEVISEHVSHHILCDTAGNTINSESGALNIHHVDVHDTPVNAEAHMVSGATTTLDGATAVDDITVDVISGTGFTVGDRILLDGDLPTITAIATNTFTLDAPITRIIASGTAVEESTVNLAVSGTLASPKIFKIEPPASEIWHVLRIIFVMNHTAAADLSAFGDLTALTNGLLIRTVKSGVNIQFTNWKSNNDIKKSMFDVEFTDKAKSSGSVYGTSGRLTLSKLGVAAKLDGSAGDYLEIRVQDDLTSLDNLEFMAQGHVA